MNITSKIVALSSAVAFALQIALALLMLRYFSPEEVGMFSVISQIGFFWTTLALAQAPLRLLANHGASVFEDARHAWVSSLQRFVWLSPVVALAVWWSGLSFVNALFWALMLSLCQLTWMLAQSTYLRIVLPWPLLVGVRVLPPLTSLLFVITSVLFLWDGPALLASALFGYAIGAIWLLPFIFSVNSSTLENRISQSSYADATENENLSTFSKSIFLSTKLHHSDLSDDRSTSLRMAHALGDALLATSVVLVWQRLYGAEETGWMVAPLRVMGFLPAVIHISWVQVLLAQPQHSRTNSLWVGLGGFAIVVILVAIGAVAIEISWFSSHWQGALLYFLPLALWQGCACISAAYSHRPFESRVASKYSRICIAISIMQGCTLLLPFFLPSLILSAADHIWMFSVTSGLGLLATAYWLANLSPSPKVFRIES
jgi:hypothetical protein